MPKDPYKTLGVARSASADEIQKAYRRLARKYHPDMSPDDATAKKKFQDVQSAFDILGDPAKRQKFDQFGHAFESMGSGQGGPKWTHSAGPQTYPSDLNDLFGGMGGGGGFSDLFKQFRGGGREGESPTAARGAHLRHELTVPFNTAVLGGEAAVSIRRATGKTEVIQLKIPAGIEDGKKIRLRGQGEPGTGRAPAGDILVTIRVSPHPHFRRTGKRLDVRVPVTLAEAALGATIDVPTPQGTIALRIPPGSSGGTRLRIKGHGVPARDGTKGDLFAELQIVLPAELTADERQQMADISNAHPQNPRTELRW